MKKILAEITPQLNQLVGERTVLESERAKLIGDLNLSRKNLAEIDAAVQGFQRQIDDRSKSTAEQFKSIDQKILKQQSLKEAANSLLVTKEAAFNKFIADNADKWGPFVSALGKPGGTLTDEQYALLVKRAQLETEIDVLEETIQGYVSQIAQFQKVRVALANGDTTALNELNKKLDERKSKRPAAQKKFNETLLQRKALDQQLAQKMAVIAGLSDLKIPDIHPICSKIRPNG